jgi:hypothetical protein
MQQVIHVRPDAAGWTVEADGRSTRVFASLEAALEDARRLQGPLLRCAIALHDDALLGRFRAKRRNARGPAALLTEVPVRSCERASA